jgi:hypothetical protein
VSAEADAAGDWYYGTVTLEDVTAYLESAERAGVTKNAAGSASSGKAQQ